MGPLFLWLATLFLNPRADACYHLGLFPCFTPHSNSSEGSQAHLWQILLISVLPCVPPSLGGGLYTATGELWVGDPAQQAPTARQRVTELLWAASFPRGLQDSGLQGPGAPALIHTETCIEESIGPVTCPKTQGLKDVYSVWTLVSEGGFI